MNIRTLLRHTFPVVLALGTFAGCAKPPLPTYPPLSLDDARPIIAQRTPNAFTLSGQLRLQDNSRSIQLDAALVVQQPDRLRLRAWKFGQAVFDLTIRPDGVYVFSGRKEMNVSALRQIADSVNSWLALLGSIPADAQLHHQTRDEWVFERQIGPARVLTYLDRPTLVVVRHEIFDQQTRRAMIELSNYALNGDTPWPGRIVISESRRRIEVRTASVRFDAAPAAFEPPKRAERLVP